MRLSIDQQATETLAPDTAETDPSSTWRGELADRLQAYRVRRRKVAPDMMQSQLPFAEPLRTVKAATSARTSTPIMNSGKAYTTMVAVEERTPATGSPETKDELAVVGEAEPVGSDFSFTIAIGRVARERPADGRVLIDVSPASPEEQSAQEPLRELSERAHAGLYPVALMWDRRIAGVIDIACLLFACGGFLALFGSLGGHFILSKLSAAVCMTALAVVYLQYFALFTIFGGTTPGMMLRNLQVMSFTGDEPTPRQMLLRSVGYMLSAAPCLMGFLWAVWDEDGLTWHDRFSKTYLSAAQTYAEIESHTAVHPH